MVGKVNFQIKGGRELEQALRDAGPAIAIQAGDKGLRAFARLVVREAKRLVPKDTGALRRSITAVKARAQGGAYAATRTVLVGFKPPTSRRAHLTEFGTVHRPAFPFIRPALDSQAQPGLAAMAKAMADSIARGEFKKAYREGVDFSEFDEV